MRQEVTLPVVWAALLASMLVFLGVALFLRPRLEQAEGLGVLTWMSLAWCVLSTVTAVLLQTMAGEAEASRRRSLRIASFAILESGAVFAGVAHLLSTLDYGIYGAFVPLGAMLALFPRSG
ncbi:MAG TPA: hypothetical protein VFM88_20370 [Vicinamibacteria bacterium]|nr:hypothetical protein [Vicinamibacteria bacterium]